MSNMKDRAPVLVVVVAAFLALAMMVFGAVTVNGVRRDVAHVADDLDATMQRHKLGAGPGPLFTGKQWFRQYSLLNEQVIEAVHVAASTPTVVYTMPTPAVGEFMAYEAIIHIRYDESDAAVTCNGGVCGTVIRRYLPGEFRNGVFCRYDGVCSATGLTTGIDHPVDSDTPATGLMAGTAAQLVWTGTSVGLQVSCNVGCNVAGNISGWHETDPGNGTPAVLNASPSLLATTYTTGMTVTITTTPGAATSATAATFDGVSLTGCTAPTSSTVVCTLPPGTRTAGTGNVTVTSPASPSACINCGTFAQSAVTGISPSSGPTGGGTTVTITLNAGATGGCATVPQLCSSAATNCTNVTACTVVNDTTITATSASSATNGTGNVNVTSPSTPTAGANLWTYTNVAAPTLTQLDPVTGGGVHFAPLIAKAVTTGAGGTATTLQGTGLTSVTSVKVCGVAATGVSSTSTSVTYTPPSGLTASNTAACGNVTVTTAGGTATGAPYWVVPTYTQLNIWYPAAPYVTTGTGIASITDAIGGVVVSQATGTKQPTLGSLTVGASPETMTFASASTQNLVQGTYTGPIASGTVNGQIIIGSTASAATTQVMVDSTTANVTELYMFTDNAIHCNTGGANENVSTSAFNGGALHYASCWETYTTASLAGVDTGFGTGHVTGGNSQSGITIGSEYNSTNWYNGTAVMVVEMGGGVTVSGGTGDDPAWWHTFSHNFAGTP